MGGRREAIRVTIGFLAIQHPDVPLVERASLNVEIDSGKSIGRLYKIGEATALAAVTRQLDRPPALTEIRRWRNADREAILLDTYVTETLEALASRYPQLGSEPTDPPPQAS